MKVNAIDGFVCFPDTTLAGWVGDGRREASRTTGNRSNGLGDRLHRETRLHRRGYHILLLTFTTEDVINGVNV